MLEEIEVDFKDKPIRLNHHNITSLNTLKQQLLKSYELNSNYSLWYEDNGELMCIQNQYDFSLLDGQKKLKIIVIEQQIVSSSFEPAKEPKVQQIKSVQKLNQSNVNQAIKGADEQSCECELLRTSGFTEMICLYCEKKQIRAAKSQQKERSIPKRQKQEQVSIFQPDLFYHQPYDFVVQKPIKIKNKPQIKIHIEPGKQTEFKQNQQKIKQYLDLLSTHQPISKQFTKQFTNLIDIAKLVLNYEPEQSAHKMGGSEMQLIEKYQIMQQIFSSESEQELKYFIANNMDISINQLPQKYQSYKHWC